MNIRMFPPNFSPAAQIINGVRSYSGTPGSLQDVPQADAQSLIGWTAIAPSGPTSQRPTPPTIGAGSWFIDTTLGAAIVFDGTAWRNPITSAAV